MRNSPNRSPENAKFGIPKVTISHQPASFFAGDIHLSWVTYLLGTFWESPWITQCLRQLRGIKTLNSYRNTAAYHCAAQKTSFNTSAEALSFLLQLLDRSFFRIKASGLPRHCGVTLMASSGNWVFCRKIATSTSLTQTMQRHPSCQPLSVLHWSFTLIETTKAASRKDMAAEMQRHVLPLSRDTKT